MSQIYGSTISFAYFEMFFLKIPKVKNFCPPPKGGVIAPLYIKITYDLITAAINKCFKFQNDWLKIICISTTARNFFLHHFVKEIKNFEQHRNILNE